MSSIGTKDKDFLQCFWDLASNDAAKRVSASVHIVEFVAKNLDAERDYTLKRLVKGLGSSRDSARQGFATCLCEFLQLPGVEVAHILDVLDSTTQVTGSLKGAEERDFLFSKLFCCIALIRSGAVKNDKTQQLDILDRLLVLHEGKGWMREVVTDALLQFSASLTDAEVIHATLVKLKPLLLLPVAEMAAWQICLAIGLQNIRYNTDKARNTVTAVWQAQWKKEMSELPVSTSPVTMNIIDKLTDTLLASTTGYPKIHRVWEYLISFIVPMDINRELVASRASSLSAAQESALTVFTQFLDTQLLPMSNEKRSVAAHLTTLLVQRCPAEYLPIALTPATVQFLKTARFNKKHTLHSLAGTTLDKIVSSAGSDVSVKLALISAFVQYGSANFDVLTNTHTVDTLLSGLSHDAVAAHVNLLTGLIVSCTESGESKNTSKDTEKKVKNTSKSTQGDSDNEGEEIEAEEEEEESQLVSSLSALDALVSLVKNTRLAQRSLVITTVVTVLTRLSAFGSGTVAFDAAEDKKDAKSDKKQKKRKSSSGNLAEDVSADYITTVSAALAANSVLPLPPATIAAVKILDATLASASVPEELASAAGSKLLSILADVGAQSLTQLDQPAKGKVENTEETEGAVPTATEVSAVSTPTVLQLAWSAVWQMSLSEIPFRVTETNEDADGEELAAVVMAIHELFSQSPAAVQSVSEDTKTVAQAGRLNEALSALIVHTLFQALVSKDSDTQVLEGLVSIVPALLLPPSESPSKEEEENEEGSDEGDAQSGALMQLFDLSLELLSLNAEQNQSTRGLRDGVKKVWQCACAIQGSSLSVDVINSIVSVVAGDAEESRQQGEHDGEDGEDGEGSDAENEGSEAGSDEESADEMDVEEAPIPAKSAKSAAESAPPAKNTKNNKNKTTAAEEGEEEDVVISREDAFDMLVEGAEDDDNSEQGLQHSAEMDEALAQMIALKNQSRKAGMQLAQRQALLVRSRSLDILEIVIQKIDRGVLLFPLFHPLLETLNTCYNSILIQTISEGATFTNRLQSLVEQKLCKKKINLNITLGDCTAEEVSEQFEDLNTLLVRMLNSPIVPARQIAQTAYMTVARAVHGSESAPARALLAASMESLFTTYTTKKNARITSKFIEDLVLNRLTDISVPVVWGALVSKLSALEHSFLRTELTTVFAAVLKKYHGLATAAQDTVRAHFATGLTALTAQVESILAEPSADPQALSGKKLKPVLSAIKDVTDFLKKAVPVKEGSKDKVVTFKDLSTVRAHTEKLNAVLETLQGRLTVTKSTDAADTETTEKAAKGKKQNAQSQNSLLPVLKQITANTASFLAGTAALTSEKTTITATPGKGKKSKTPSEPVTDKKAAVTEATPKKARSNSTGEDSVASSKAVSEKKRKIDVTAEPVTPAAKADKSAASAVKSEKKAKKEKK